MAREKKAAARVPESADSCAWNLSTHRIPRIFVSEMLALGAAIRLPEHAARHIAVLRIREGETITLFNGDGGEYTAHLASIARNRCIARITGHDPANCESSLDITLVQCISANDRMDFVLQKATELGATTIVPVISERSIVRVSGERAERKLAHWRNVVIAACEQCGRNRLPEVPQQQPLRPWLASLPAKDAMAATRLLLAPDGDIGPASLPRASRVILLIGPEGGLAAHEQEAAEHAGFTPVRLGPRVLRTETAPLAALAALQTLWGDLG